MVGTVIMPTFAQQFKEPEYVIRGGEVVGFELDPATSTLTVSLDIRARGELTITIPRNLIDAKIGSQDSDFIVSLGLAKVFSYGETKTKFDRTLTIPFKRGPTELTIIGTQVFSQQIAESPTIQQNQIEKKIEAELRSEIPEGKAKLLIFSDTQWSGALQASGFDYTEIAGQHDKSIIFDCEPSIIREGVFGVKIQKTTRDGYLRIVAIQGQTIMSQDSTEVQMGDVTINGNCISSFTTSPGGGGCLIATATFGSELAPQVQQLRELRDSKLLQTNSGLEFMELFNQFYYSFSPMVADLERENPVFKEAVRLTITPLLASLSRLTYVDMDSEVEVVGYGISLIMLNVGMYFVAPAMIIAKIRPKKN